MDNLRRCLLACAVFCSMVMVAGSEVGAQEAGVVLSGPQLARVVPPGFYFEGQSAPTQMRNAVAARFGAKRHVIAGIVDTSGYSADIRAKYEGFLIADSSIRLGGETLGVGAYGFGFADDGKLNVFDVGGKQVLSTETKEDRALRRPRPLMMMKSGDEVRLYSGRRYVVVAAQ